MPNSSATAAARRASSPRAKVVGLISRQRFFQLLGHRFGASLFLDAPVQKILAAGRATI